MARGEVLGTRTEEIAPGAWSLLRQRDFALYWWAGMVSGPGTWLHNVTASVLMLQMTGSPFMVGLVNFATFIPILLFSLPAGSLGDRFDKRRVVAWSQAAALLVATGLALLSGLGMITPWPLIGACFLLGTAAAVAKPSMTALLPALVPRSAVARATAVNVTQFQFGQIAGPALASLILIVGSPTWAFAINAATFLGPIAAMPFIRPREDEGHGRKAGGGSVREGLRFIRRSGAMPAILLSVVLCNAAVEALRTLSPTLADQFERPEAAGIVIMGYSVGAMLGLVSYGRIEDLLPRRLMLVTAFGLQAVGVACVALAPSLAITVVAAAPIGIGFSLSVPLLSASLQELAPDEFRTRVMSTFSMAHLGLRPLFALGAGALASGFGVHWALAVFALVAVLAGGFVRYRRVGYE
ncbi:MAG: transporter [Blastococcus sp.]|nr:transporter [Blastococcus sp.]